MYALFSRMRFPAEVQEFLCLFGNFSLESSIISITNESWNALAHSKVFFSTLKQKSFFSVWISFQPESDLSGFSWSLLPSCGFKKNSQIQFFYDILAFSAFLAGQFLCGTPDTVLNIYLPGPYHKVSVMPHSL